MMMMMMIIIIIIIIIITTTTIIITIIACKTRNINYRTVIRIHICPNIYPIPNRDYI